MDWNAFAADYAQFPLPETEEWEKAEGRRIPSRPVETEEFIRVIASTGFLINLLHNDSARRVSTHDHRASAHLHVIGEGSGRRGGRLLHNLNQRSIIQIRFFRVSCSIPS